MLLTIMLLVDLWFFNIAFLAVMKQKARKASTCVIFLALIGSHAHMLFSLL